VKGHQDKDPKRKLTLPEQLNIDCDHQAKLYAKSATQSSTALGNPAIPVAQPHLIIAGKLICRKVIPNLRQTTSALLYRRYLKDKFSWNEHSVNAVHWEVLSSTIKSFQLEDQRRLVLFINNKLPLRASKAHPHYGSKLCPSCQREAETAQHFMTCMHPTREALFRTLKESLSTMTQKLRLQPYLLTSLWLGLAAHRTGIDYPPILDDLPQHLHASIQTQTRLGWGQLYQGHVAITWAQAIDDLHPNLAPSGTQVMISMLRLVWTYVLAVWKTRNQQLHSASQLDLPDYRQAASTLYELRYQLPPDAQTALYQQPLEQILALPAPRLQRWVQAGYKYFNQQLKAAKKQAALQTPDIRSFFRPQSPQTQPDDDLQPP